MPTPDLEFVAPVELFIPADARWLTVVRLMVSGVASRVGASYEDVDDIKVAVSEACTNAIDHAFPDPACPRTIRIVCYPGQNELRIEVCDEGCGFDPATAEVVDDDTDPEKRGGLGLYLIRKLMDETEVISRPGGGTKVTMLKRFEG
ncbi:MAG: ATP-binding protein [Candidatus Zipacnadales bacterium]